MCGPCIRLHMSCVFFLILAKGARTKREPTHKERQLTQVGKELAQVGRPPTQVGRGDIPRVCTQTAK